MDANLSKDPIIDVTVRKDGTEYVNFIPTVRMKAFAVALFSEPALRNGTPENVLQHLGFPKNLWKHWQGFNPYFEEWLADVEVMYSPKHVARQIEAVGLEKALSGDFNFWKAFALKHKVISPDSATLTVIPANLDNFKDWSEADVEKHRANLMDTIRRIPDQGRTDLAAENPGGRSESNPRGTSTLEQEPLEVPAQMGPNGERSP